MDILAIIHESPFQPCKKHYRAVVVAFLSWASGKYEEDFKTPEYQTQEFDECHQCKMAHGEMKFMLSEQRRDREVIRILGESKNNIHHI